MERKLSKQVPCQVQGEAKMWFYLTLLKICIDRIMAEVMEKIFVEYSYLLSLKS